MLISTCIEATNYIANFKRDEIARLTDKFIEMGYTIRDRRQKKSFCIICIVKHWDEDRHEVIRAIYNSENDDR